MYKPRPATAGSPTPLANPYRPLDQRNTQQNKPQKYRAYFEQSSDSSERGDCQLWSKYAIFGINIIFMVVGTLVLAMGAWLRTDSRFRDFLSERYRQAVHEAFWEAPTLYAFSYILIVLGASLILMAMFGCCGAIVQSKLLLGVYGIGTFLLLIFTIGCGSFIIYTKDSIDVELSDALNYMVQHYYQGAGIVQESLDRLQQAFRCCGNAGCSDFSAFRQDPPRTCDIRCDGCHYRIWLALRIGFSVALAVFSIVILAQLVAIAISVTMICAQDVDDPYYNPGGTAAAALRRKERNQAHFQRQMYAHSGGRHFGQDQGGFVNANGRNGGANIHSPGHNRPDYGKRFQEHCY